MIWNIGKEQDGSDSRTADEATPKVRDAITRACVKSVADAGKSRYVDDLSYHAISLPFLFAVAPDARVIRCSRDAEDIIPELVYSWKRTPSLLRVVNHRRRNFVWSSLPGLAWRFGKRYFTERVRKAPSTWGPNVPGLAAYAAEHGPILAAAYQWTRMMEIFLADLEAVPPERVLSVRYEDLLSDLDRECERIGAFSEVRDLEAMKASARRFVDPRHVGPWYQLDQQEWDGIRRIVDPMNVREGYSPLPEEVPTQALRHRGEPDPAH